MPYEVVSKELVKKIENLLKNARKNFALYVNTNLLATYMDIGKAIVDEEIKHVDDLDYKNKSLRYLSKILTKKLGKGFSKSNLFNMRQFYIRYKSVQSLTGQLTWTYYCELLSISDDEKRKFYENECSNARWSVRELRRQIESSLFERLLLSNGKANKEQVLKLALKGNEIITAEDIIKEPYVFEFAGVPENKPILESELESALIRQIETFLLELGKGFMFVGSQQRVTYNNIHYYVDMVFYNKILKSYVLIELKTTKLMPEAVGQLNMYLNYYASEINDIGDNPPIGIILCTEKGNINLEYALGGLNNKIFASKYVTYLPKKEELIAQVENIIKKNGTKK